MTCRLRWFPPRRCSLLAGLLFLAACTEADRPAAYVGSSPDLLPPPADGADGGDPAAPCTAAQGMPGTLLTYGTTPNLKPFCLDFKDMNAQDFAAIGFSAPTLMGCSSFTLTGGQLVATPSGFVQPGTCTLKLPPLTLPSASASYRRLELHLVHSLYKLSDPSFTHQVQAEWGTVQRHALNDTGNFMNEQTTWVFRVHTKNPLLSQLSLSVLDTDSVNPRTLPTWSISSIAILAVP